MKKFFSIALSLFLVVVTHPTKIEAQTKSRQEEYFEVMDALIESETYFGLTGAQVAIMHKGEFVHSKAYGSLNNYSTVLKADGSIDLKDYKVIPKEERIAVDTNTLFDLASNTKMYAGVYAVQHLIDQGKLSLDTKIQDLFPEFVYQGKGHNNQDKITVEDILMHKAGFTPDPQYHNNTYDENIGSNKNENYLYTQDPKKIKEMVLKTPLENPQGEHAYSDADFMLLGMVVEEISGMPFDTYVYENIFKPLGIKNVTFNPLDHGFTKDQITASEVHGNTRDGEIDFNNVRKDVVQGEVHDEKAFYSMGGVSGHAGLFGNAEEIAKLAYEMISDDSMFSKEVRDRFSISSEVNDTYAVGWRKQGASKKYDWAFSPYASENTIGHTGWTGTLTLIDPDNDLVLVLLTNSRNTPIMGPGANDFFTKDLNVNSYGVVSTLAYEAMSLGSDKTAAESLIDLFEAELVSDFKEESISKRNAVRALIKTIESVSESDPVLKDYMSKDVFQNALSDLKPFNDTDFKHLLNDESNQIGHNSAEKPAGDVTQEQSTKLPLIMGIVGIALVGGIIYRNYKKKN